jgi:hypothetical protein
MQVNPFQYTGVVTEQAFVPRGAVSNILQEHFESRQNLLVQGARRMGKTSVIMRTFTELQAQKQCFFLHVDFYGVSTLEGVRDKLLRGIEQLPLEAQLKKKLEEPFQRLTGFQAFGFGVNWRRDTREVLLEDILGFLPKINAVRPLAVFFDEFQDLLNLPSAREVLGRLRSEIQQQPNVFYLFAGSDQIPLREIFFIEKSPFFKSAAVTEVGPIAREDFVPWLTQRFEEGDRSVKKEIWEPIFDAVYDVPGDIQHFCHTLWTLSRVGDLIDEPACDRAVQYLLDMQEKTFEDFWRLLAENQKRLLRGLAQTPEAGHTTAAFLRRTGINSSAASSKALEAMLNKGALWHPGEQVAFTNPFLRLWLLRRSEL